MAWLGFEPSLVSELMLLVHLKKNSKNCSYERQKEGLCGRQSSPTTHGILYDTEDTQPWAWRSVGLFGWKSPFPFLGKLAGQLYLQGTGLVPAERALWL